MNVNFKSLISRLNSVQIMVQLPEFTCLPVQNHWQKKLKLFLKYQTIRIPKPQDKRLPYHKRKNVIFSLALPWSGTSVGRIIRRICSIDCKSGDKPVKRINRKVPKSYLHHYTRACTLSILSILQTTTRTIFILY